MNLEDIVTELKLEVLTNQKDFNLVEPTSVYAADLLSCVMAGAEHKSVWITLQSHSNIVAVGSLLELSAIIITESAKPDQETIDKANEEGIIMLSTSEPSFYVSGKLWEMGLRPKS
jgi:hypothetical protein